jgi:hypothetical protein
VITCFTHPCSACTVAAAEAGFARERVEEFFDEDDRAMVPGIFMLLFGKGKNKFGTHNQYSAFINKKPKD